MIFGKKYKNKLPKFPASVIPTFKMLMEVLDESGVAQLREALEAFLEKFKSLAKDDPNLDYRDAEEVVAVCHFLLDQYPNADLRGKEMVVAAVRYVAVADDPFCDATFASGFFDDKKVVNHVLEFLDIHDHYLRISQ